MCVCVFFSKESNKIVSICECFKIEIVSRRYVWL